MNAEESESLFRDYLKNNRLQFTEAHPVNSHNVDFCISRDTVTVFCDVKEVRASRTTGEVDAYANIREDIRKLRDKFAQPPGVPVILVSMNFSIRPFTGFTVCRALMGDIAVEVDKKRKQLASDLHHLHRGNAALTSSKNRSISGVFAFDLGYRKHCVFLNPYARHLLPEHFFPDTKVIHLNENEMGWDITELSSLMFWPKQLPHPLTEGD